MRVARIFAVIIAEQPLRRPLAPGIVVPEMRVASAAGCAYDVAPCRVQAVEATKGLGRNIETHEKQGWI